MKTKTLALVNGLVGLIGGIILLLWPFFIWVFYFMLGVFDILKIAILALGIAGIVYYKDDNRISLAPSILFIVGSVVALIPFLGWIGGIVLVIIFVAKMLTKENQYLLNKGEKNHV